jgi:hypothetical protein
LRRSTSSSRGFILVLVVGALSVLTVLGLSFSEQSRADLLGASNGRDLLAADGLAETGFQMALRILADDRNVWSTSSVAWDQSREGVGHTSRWGYNVNYDLPVDANQDATVSTPSGIQAHTPLPAGQSMGTAYNHRLTFPRNYLDSWQMMIWNEEPFNNNGGYAYTFKFDPTTTPPVGYRPSKTYYNQRRPADSRIMLDTWAFQPLARVKRFKIRSGLNYGVLQISIVPRDGAINVNDVYDPGTTQERWGFHDYYNFNGSNQTDPLASPDRRTLDYILGRRPEYAAAHTEYVSYDPSLAPTRVAFSKAPGPTYVPSSLYDKFQFVANEPSGSVFIDNGIYNFRGMAEPNGRTYATTAGWPLDDPLPPIAPSSSCYGRLTNINGAEPLIFYNGNLTTYYRYNFEAPRYPCYVAMAGPSMRYDGGSGRWLTQSGTPNFWETAWWPTGRSWRSPVWSGNDIVDGGAQPTSGPPAMTLAPDALFQGMGFDLNNPKRGGLGAAAGDPAMFITDDSGETVYNGAGMYGHPVPHSFQHHFIASVQQGKFWTDLEANWFFGGSPGYTNKLGRWPDEPTTDQWTYLGSSYDSLGIGTNWMPPTCHVWMPGFFNGTGQLDAYEASCGLLTSPRNMLPAKPAATYSHPLTKWGDDFGAGSPHFGFSNQRNMIRAFGIQENFGPANSGNNDNRMYDAININVAPYEVVYGLLTPEKIPSMLNRTVVAPHLHWKARYFDGAYGDAGGTGTYNSMKNYERYTPTGDPSKPSPNFPTSYPDAPYMPKTKTGAPAKPDGLVPAALTLMGVPATPITNPFGSIDYNGNFKEFQIDDTVTYPIAATATNFVKAVLPGPFAGPYYCVMGPAPFNYSIHRQYEPLTVAPYSDWSYPNQHIWYPTSTGNAHPVGMVLNKMDFRTPEPLLYRMVYRANGNLTPDPMVATDYVVRDYKIGSGEAADDVFVDCHYDLELAPNSTLDVDPLSAASMMPRPSLVTQWSDWFSQRTCGIDDFYATGNYVPGDNTYGKPPYTYPDGRKFLLTDYDSANHVRAGKQVKPHPLYGVPNPDYMLQYPGTYPNYHWSDQFRRYFPVEGSPADFTASVAAAPPLPGKPDGIGYLAKKKDSDVVDLSPFYKPITTTSYSMAPAPYLKMVDDVENQALPFIQPQVSTPKSDKPFMKSPFIPGISKDDAWRITRVGRKYQESITDEILDYTINPHWPNPIAQFSEMAVPLDMQNYPGDARYPAWVDAAVPLPGFIGNTYGANYQNDQPTKTMNSIVWNSFNTFKTQGNIGDQVPDFYAYFNRFWIRAAHTYARNAPNTFFGRYNDYRVGVPYGKPNGVFNLVEARGKYPQTYQYWGEFFNGSGALDPLWSDNIRDFPENTLEDQLGSDFRYLTTATKPMFETPPSPGVAGGSAGNIPVPASQMSAAPGRNHPFKNWADFVAMLGHLVYRSPLTVIHPAGLDSRVVDLDTIRKDRVNMGIRDRILGVNAWQVCHGTYADPRNKDQFFDGSKIAAGATGPAYADSLQGFYGYDSGSDTIKPGVGLPTAQESIVAVDGFWPISGNLGVFLDPTGTLAGGPPESFLYPPRPAGLFADTVGGHGGDADWEWKRRIDEWRGCDAAGLRVEQQYISERAANDILVSLSNGQIGPIDFDGDGHITMTRKQEIPTETLNPPVAGYTGNFWPLFPYNKMSGASNVEYIKPPAQALPLGYGVIDHPSKDWKPADKGDVIQNCVTLPIKFRSNTFRVTVAVELTDSKFRNTAAVHKYSRVFSRVMDKPAGLSKVHGPYTGEFIMHGNRAIDGVDPEGSWLGADFGTE